MAAPGELRVYGFGGLYEFQACSVVRTLGMVGTFCTLVKVVPLFDSAGDILASYAYSGGGQTGVAMGVD